MKIKKFNEINESYLSEDMRELLQNTENILYLKDTLEYTITQLGVWDGTKVEFDDDEKLVVRSTKHLRKCKI